MWFSTSVRLSMGNGIPSSPFTTMLYLEQCAPTILLQGAPSSILRYGILISIRTFSTINAYFPSVLEYEIPQFLSDMSSVRNGTDTPYFTPALSSSDAVYAMFIGTNDLGVYAFLTDAQVPGNTLSSYTSCVYTALDKIYAAGGRYFVLMNVIPLNLAALYSNASFGGQIYTHYWPGKPSNLTHISIEMDQFVTSVDSIYRYQTPFESLISQRYPGAHFALFDTWQLIWDIYNNPTMYLNGSQPANVTGFEHHCNINGTVCQDVYDGTSPDSFLFYDELHPR